MLNVSAYLSCQWNFYWDRNKFCQETSIKCHHKHNWITIRKYESYLQKYSKIRKYIFLSFGRERGCFLICGTKFSQQCPGSQITRQRNTKYWDNVLLQVTVIIVIVLLQYFITRLSSAKAVPHYFIHRHHFQQQPTRSPGFSRGSFLVVSLFSRV